MGAKFNEAVAAAVPMSQSNNLGRWLVFAMLGWTPLAAIHSDSIATSSMQTNSQFYIPSCAKGGVSHGLSFYTLDCVSWLLTSITCGFTWMDRRALAIYVNMRLQRKRNSMFMSFWVIILVVCSSHLAQENLIKRTSELLRLTTIIKVHLLRQTEWFDAACTPTEDLDVTYCSSGISNDAPSLKNRFGYINKSFVEKPWSWSAPALWTDGFSVWVLTERIYASPADAEMKPSRQNIALHMLG